jgi:hypothetical protein
MSMKTNTADHIRNQPQRTCKTSISIWIWVETVWLFCYLFSHAIWISNYRRNQKYPYTFATLFVPGGLQATIYVVVNTSTVDGPQTFSMIARYHLCIITLKTPHQTRLKNDMCATRISPEMVTKGQPTLQRSIVDDRYLCGNVASATDMTHVYVVKLQWNI